MIICLQEAALASLKSLNKTDVVEVRNIKPQVGHLNFFLNISHRFYLEKLTQLVEREISFTVTVTFKTDLAVKAILKNMQRLHKV